MSALLSHPTGVPTRVPHNDDIDNLSVLPLKTLFSPSPYRLLQELFCFTARGSYTPDLCQCSVQVEVAVHHRTFLVTMTATSVLMCSYYLAEKILL